MYTHTYIRIYTHTGHLSSAHPIEIVSPFEFLYITAGLLHIAAHFLDALQPRALATVPLSQRHQFAINLYRERILSMSA
jgi:hypothetical protein